MEPGRFAGRRRFRPEANETGHAMNEAIGLERCLSFIRSQVKPAGKPAAGEAPGHRPAVTISRQTGCGAHQVANLLAEHLQAHAPPESPPWTVFDRNLVEKVLEDHNLPQRLEKFMPEDRVSELEEMLDGLFELRPPASTLVRKTSETILRLAELGHVIIVGRGANVITAALPHVFHVRLVGSLEKRIARLRQTGPMSEAEARKIIQQEDEGRRRYLQKYFNRDIDDPLLYHVAFNTDLVPPELAARLIAEAVLNRPRAETLSRG